MQKKHLTIATRESPLALWQANWIKKYLQILYPTLTIDLLGMTTQADKVLETPLTKIGGKGLFVKELEEALLDGRADIAVHSMKDVPMELPQGLCLPVMCEREDPRDAFVSNDYGSWQALPPGARVGTSSLRRQRQFALLRPDLEWVNLRGNVNTRLAKLDRGEYAAIILAAAGLKRLDFAGRICTYLSTDDSLPAAGQGVLGIECRLADEVTQQLIAPLQHPATQACVIAERAVCRRLGGSCQIPIAAFAELQGNRIFLRSLVASVAGPLIFRTQGFDLMENAEQLGMRLAENLLAQGAGEILKCFVQKR